MSRPSDSSGFPLPCGPRILIPGGLTDELLSSQPALGPPQVHADLVFSNSVALPARSFQDLIPTTALCFLWLSLLKPLTHPTLV